MYCTMVPFMAKIAFVDMVRPQWGLVVGPAYVTLYRLHPLVPPLSFKRLQGHLVYPFRDVPPPQVV